MTVPGTISLPNAAARTWDVAVVGAGPAGSVAARELARGGASVLLVDRENFPRRKVCGCCLNGNAMAALAAVGLGELPHSLGAIPLQGVKLGASARQVQLKLPGASLSRDALDVALIREAVKSGVQFLPQTRAKLGPVQNQTRVVWLNESSTSAKIVLAADGLNGRLAASAEGFEVPASATARIGAGAVLAQAPASYAPGLIFMAAAPGGYVGLVRLEDHRLDVAAAFDAEFVRQSGSLGSAAIQVLKAAGFPELPGLLEADWKGTPPLTRRPDRLAGERWFAVGDASGYIEPFTGEGMAWAMGGAAALAPLARRAIQNWHPSQIAEWSRIHRSVIGQRQRVCRWVARVLRSERWSGWSLRALTLWPRLANPVVRILNRPPVWPQESPL